MALHTYVFIVAVTLVSISLLDGFSFEDSEEDARLDEEYYQQRRYLEIPRKVSRDAWWIPKAKPTKVYPPVGKCAYPGVPCTNDGYSYNCYKKSCYRQCSKTKMWKTACQLKRPEWDFGIQAMMFNTFSCETTNDCAKRTDILEKSNDEVCRHRCENILFI